MLLTSKFALLTWSILAISFDQAVARERWLERDGRAVYLYPRRFGQEQPAVLEKIRAACPGQVCGTLAGQAVTPLLAAQPECSQQDMADAIIDASRQFDAATQKLMIAAAVEYRQVEKNTPPDFTKTPPTARNSVFCQKAPKNAELNGLVQAQDPANDPNVFFDPAKSASVLKGTQANTSPFNGDVAQPAPEAETPAETEPVLIETPTATDCASEVTVTVTATASVTATDAAVTVTAGDTATAAPPAATTPVDAPAGADFGSCTVPEIEFAVGFDNRKETSFQPTDKQSYNHGSAQNIAIITQFICDTLTNSCKANQAAKDVCAKAQTAALAATSKTGAQADAFNAAFGITTTFSTVAVVDNQGNIVTPGTGSAAPVSGGIGNFGKCSVPEIEFAAGFDGRKETSFQPTDKASFNHGSAQNIDIITRSICDTLTNSCGADATAKATCATASTAASNAAKGTGAQADAFNAVFGITTNFAAVQQIDNQGRVVGAAAPAAPATTAAAPATTAAAPATTATAPATTAAAPVTTAAAPATTAASSATTVAAPVATASQAASNSGNLQTFKGALGGVVAPVVTAVGNGQFQVAGNSAFNNQKNAIVRSCDVQNNQCANAANASGNKGDLTVSACNAQQSQCIATAN